MDNTPKQKMNFEQAANKIKEQKDELNSGKFYEKIKQEIEKNAPISYVPPRDRFISLVSALSFFDTISPWGCKTYLKVTGKIPSSSTCKEICNFLKEILFLRIKGYTYKYIVEVPLVKEFKGFKYGFMIPCPETMCEVLEQLAKLELEQALTRHNTKDVPVFS